MGKIKCEYPFKDEEISHHPHFVKYPLLWNGGWYAVNVVSDGFVEPTVFDVKFDNEEACVKSVKVHNDWLKKRFNKTTAEIEQIIFESFAPNYIYN